MWDPLRILKAALFPGGTLGAPHVAEFLELPNAPKKTFSPNKVAPLAPEKSLDWPKSRSKIWRNHFKGGGGTPPSTPTPTPRVVLSC